MTQVVYFARSMAAQTKTDVQTTPDGKPLHDAVVEAVHKAGFKIQFDIQVVGLDKAALPPAEYIYRRDIQWLYNSDLVIAEVSEPSTGVGFELAVAEFDLKLPMLVVARQGARVSAMVSGHLEVAYYKDLDDLSAIIQIWLGECLP